MQQLVNALIRFRNGLVYLLLLSFSIFLLQHSSSYHRSLIANAGLFFGTQLNDVVSSVSSYLSLRTTNQLLVEENQILLDQILSEKNLPADSLMVGTIKLQVIRNSFTNSYNYITLRGGKRDGLEKEMGLITARGIVGIVQFVNQRYSQAISVLNKDLQINAKLKNSNHFGSLRWNGDDPTKMNLIDMPKTAVINIGDTIQTGGMSTIFPAGVPIGTITNYIDNPSVSFYDIEVSLFQDMTNLGAVFAIDHPFKGEVKSIQQSNDEQ
jgi:rod shape-determining protein MreC